MMSGGPILPDFAFADAKIIDVAPTVLYLLGLPVPDDMDGRVLTEALDEDFVSSKPICYENSDDDANTFASNLVGEARQEFDDEESEMIAKRLQALGYIQ
jgi:arylsulfatase A-like enzyme